MASSNHHPFEILLIEDNPGDIRLTREALKLSDTLCNLHTVRDGVQAMDFLLKRNNFENSPYPHFIILDLNLPRKDGREVLREIKSEPSLKIIPVLVLTTSNDKNDILQSYELHANCYIIKPIDIDQFLQVFESIKLFWFTHVKLPKIR